MAGESERYLKRELDRRLAADPGLLDLLEAGVADGLSYWDLERPTREWVSPRFQRLLGYGADEAPSDSLWRQRRIHPEDISVSLENLQNHLAAPSRPYDHIVRYRHRSGSTLWVHCRGLALRNDHGAAVRLLAAHTDVTELKQGEQRLREREAELLTTVAGLESANRTLDAFAQAASHDLREPLRNLVAYSNLLREDLGDGLPPDAARDLAYITESAERMNRLVEDVFTFSRAGSDQMRWESVCLNACLWDALKTLGPRIEASGARIHAGSLPNIYGDRALVTLLLVNLLANAIKFASRDEPRVWITAERTGAYWKLSVQDNGIGIDADRADEVFEPFRRLHRSDDREGSGLGLSIAKRAVERHLGRIWVESQPGRGACFRFTLPARPPDPRRPRASGRPELNGVGAPGR